MLFEPKGAPRAQAWTERAPRNVRWMRGKTTLRPSSVHLGPCWKRIEQYRALFGASWTFWMRLGTVLEATLGHLTPTGRLLGRLWRPLGNLWGPHGPSWGHLVPSSMHLGPSGRHLGAILCSLGAISAVLEALFAVLEAILGPSRRGRPTKDGFSARPAGWAGAVGKFWKGQNIQTCSTPGIPPSERCAGDGRSADELGRQRFFSESNPYCDITRR